MIRVGLLLLALLTAAACTARRPPASPPPAQQPGFDELLEGYLGFADWTCKFPNQSAWVRISYHGADLVRVREDGGLVVSPVLVETIVHELEHLRQMRAHSCEEWQQLSQSREFRDQQERQANCVAQRVVHRKECEER